MGTAHGALNCAVYPADGSQWFFKQFISEEEFEQYVAGYNLTIVKGDPSE